MNLGERIRELRQAKRLTLRDLAAKVGVGFTYISKIENDKLEEGHGPSEKLLHLLAEELDADEEELLLLAERVPELIRKRVCERPEEFRRLASLDDQSLRRLMEVIDKQSTEAHSKR